MLVSRSPLRGRRFAAALLLAVFAASTAAAGMFEGWTVGETHHLDPGKFYQDVRKAPAAASKAVGVLPVALDREIAASFEYGDRRQEFDAVIAAMQARLVGNDRLRVADVSALPAEGTPRVYVGSAIGDFAPPDAEQMQEPDEQFPPMVLYLEKPSSAWQEAASKLMADQGLEHLVLVTLSVSQYPKGRSGVFAKNVRLGTGHEQPVKFLTAEDKLLEVLQVTGLLVDTQGRVVRAGAEGVLAQDTPFLAQAVEATKMLDDAAIRKVLTSVRREDLPGTPLSLEVALDNLVAQLVKDPERVRRPLE